VVRVDICLLALECLQFLMNLLQYAMTVEFVNLESRAMCSGGCRSTPCACLISRIPVGGLNSFVSQLDGFCGDLCGPFHNGMYVEVLKAHFPLK
jgi:hypothetical protein